MNLCVMFNVKPLFNKKILKLKLKGLRLIGGEVFVQFNSFRYCSLS